MESTIVSLLASLAALFSAIAVRMSQQTRKQISKSVVSGDSQESYRSSPASVDAIKVSLDHLAQMERTTQETVAKTGESLVKAYSDSTSVIAGAIKQLSDQIGEERLERVKRDAFEAGRRSAGG